MNIGSAVSLAFVVTNAGAGNFKWHFNGNEMDGANSATLTIPSFAVTNVGRYKLRVSAGGIQYFSVPIEIQINTDGAVNTLARGKILDAPDTPLIGNNGGGTAMLTAGLRPLGPSGSAGVVRGYNGSQIFDTTYATVDTNEPPHCGISGGTSYWLIYEPPTNGTAAQPSTTAPCGRTLVSRVNIMVPVGALPATVAVKSTLAPVNDGFAELCSAVVVGDVPIVTVSLPCTPPFESKFEACIWKP